MKKILGLIFATLVFISCSAQNKKSMKTLHDFTVKSIDGKEFKLSSLKGKKVMIVNTASECGLTPQYEALQELYTKYSSHNFIIIGFPANNFGSQEPGSNEQIALFCKKNYGVSFPMMSKISVAGKDIHALYQWLTQKTLNGVKDEVVTWNFQKFLIDEQGHWIKSYSPQTKPDDAEIIKWIKS
jgi:glutathione peroxidase